MSKIDAIYQLQILMNARMSMLVIQMLHAPTLWDPSYVLVMQDTLEMEGCAMVGVQEYSV